MLDVPILARQTPRMSEAALRDRADARLEKALESAGLRDPRGPYRSWLRALRERDVASFDEARRHYEERVVPRIATEEADPLAEWLAYGVRLAELSGPGRLVEIDASGRARTATEPLPKDRVVLYLPDAPREPARALNLPLRLSAAQRANHDLLVEGKVAPTS